MKITILKKYICLFFYALLQIIKFSISQAEDGKTELSLIHFALTNPDWRPPEAAEGFLTAIRSLVQNELIGTSYVQRSVLSRSKGTG